MEEWGGSRGMPLRDNNPMVGTMRTVRYEAGETIRYDTYLEKIKIMAI
jgi:hypothetical protein